MNIKIGSRKSALAIRQTEAVIEQLKAHFPDDTFEIVGISTKGDKQLDKSLQNFGGKGVFIKEIETALLDGKIDMAVHSAKDMPTEVPDGLHISAALLRDDRSDVLIYFGNTKTSDIKIIGTGIDAEQSNLREGQSTLDLAIIGNGWFCVENGEKRLYTRDGSFGISLDGEQAYLVNQSGYFVLDANGERISTRVRQGASIDNDELTQRVGVFGFDYPEALTPVSGNLYSENELTGEAIVLTEGQYELAQGYLEQSGVSMADEMVNLIAAQRAYQLSARVVQTADELEQTINSLRA